MLTFLIRFRKRLERVVKVSTEQPGFPFRFKLIRAFINFHALTMHIRDANVDRRIFVKGVSRTGAQPETVLVRNRDRTVLRWYRAVIEGDTGTERPVVIVVIGGTQRNAISVFKAFMLLKERIAGGRSLPASRRRLPLG